MNESARTAGGRWARIGPDGAMVAGVLAWLWPIGLGGRMPVGGDATQFSMGLMAFLGSSLRGGRLPLWNDLWGFGFPGLAESQMGVFYPPHLLLYGALPTEAAYTASLVLHSLWAALGASWAARRFGISPGGAALAGFAFATSGMFLIHLPHQWAYTVGSWMPWAWGLAWQVARGSGSGRTPWLLAAVLALQVLPGHFQLAFATEVGALVLALASGRRFVPGVAAVALALAGMLPLAAGQLAPTLALARLSDSGRDFEYLSGFAASPLHLVSYLAPGLFHRSPLWRPLAWDVFHTSPEEHLAYIGLIPLWLALAASLRGFRSDPGVRALVAVAAATTLLSLGPYVPGFEWLIRLPGFSFFRAPARWGLAASLALAMLGGKGFDLLPAWPRSGRSLARFAIGSALAVGLVVGGFELALGASRGSTWAPKAASFDRGLRALPWPGSPPLRTLTRAAYRPQDDLRVRSATARIEGRLIPPPGANLAAERPTIYRRELAETALLLAALLGLASLARSRPRAFASALAAVAAVDALALSRHRPFDLGPSRPLTVQSPTLAAVAAWPRGVRTLDPGQNLFLVAGADSASAYRTLDLPSPGPLLDLAREPGPMGAEALRVAGIGARVLDPFELAFPPASRIPGWRETSRSTDPELAAWLFGRDYSRLEKRADFAILRPDREPARAWLVGSLKPASGRGMADPSALIDAFRDATPLVASANRPTEDRVEVETEASGGLVVLSKTFDPEWRGAWSGPGGERPAAVESVLGGWQGIRVPGPGRWTLRLWYEGRAAKIGMAISGVAWIAWAVGWYRSNGRRRDGAAGNPGGEGS